MNSTCPAPNLLATGHRTSVNFDPWQRQDGWTERQMPTRCVCETRTSTFCMPPVATKPKSQSYNLTLSNPRGMWCQWSVSVESKAGYCSAIQILNTALYTRIVRKRGHSTYSIESLQYEIVLTCVLKNHLAIHIWIFIPKCKLLNEILNFLCSGSWARRTAPISMMFSDIITLVLNAFKI